MAQEIISLLILCFNKEETVPVAVRSKAVCGCSPAEIVVSKPTRDMDASLLGMLCVIRERSLKRADHLSRGVILTVVYHCV